MKHLKILFVNNHEGRDISKEKVVGDGDGGGQHGLESRPEPAAPAGLGTLQVRVKTKLQ